MGKLPPLPDEVLADPGMHDWYFREKKPDSVAKYIRADVSSPLGAVAMRDAAALELEHFKNSVIEAKKRDGSEKQRWTTEEVSSEVRALSRHIQGRIAAIPMPDHAALLASALKLPEVAAMVEAARLGLDDLSEWYSCKASLEAAGFNIDGTKEVIDALSNTLAALEASHE